MEVSKMKKTILSLVFLLLMCSAANAAVNTLADDMPHLFITLLNQEPDPVEPGQYVDLRFKIENYGTEPEYDVEVEILPQYPFTIVTGEEAARELGTLRGRQVGKVGNVEKFKLKVAKDAIEGENEIKVRYRSKQGTHIGPWVVWDAFNVSIRTQDAILAVKDVVEGVSDIFINSVSGSIFKGLEHPFYFRRP